MIPPFLRTKVVPSKGVHVYTVEVVRRFVEQLGYDRLRLKSDGEPAILALREAVRRERRAWRLPWRSHAWETTKRTALRRMR